VSDVETLEPGLTKADKRVLAAVPTGDLAVKCGAASIWQLGATLRTTDLVDLLRTLKGLEHLGYITGIVTWDATKAQWWRTRKGDEAAA
jgi:hypothetical protein